MSRPPLIAVVGPTAAGKTALGVALAQRLDGEIIGADSRQVYRGLDAGTAKPTPEERRRARHHLIDVINIDEAFGLAQYLQLVGEAIRDVRARGHLPILVGGTGQYVWALVEGWQTPRVPPDPELRDRLALRVEVEGPDSLHAELTARDPVAAAAIHPHNTRRVVRALEIMALTGRPASQLRALKASPPASLIFGLSMPRTVLYERIDRRVDAMFEGGLVQEVAALLQAGYASTLPSLSGIGYAQVVQYLHGDIGLDSARERTKTATHRLARQQGAWFRTDDARITWLCAGHGIEAEERAYAICQDAWHR